MDEGSFPENTRAMNDSPRSLPIDGEIRRAVEIFLYPGKRGTKAATNVYKHSLP